MSKQPAYIANLKKYAKSRPSDDQDVTQILADFTTESDRGAIILAATWLEDILELVILNKLPNAQHDEELKKRLFENDGSIATLSAKIQMAYAMGLTDRDYRKKMDLVREIRNACAHARKPLSLDNPELLTACEAVITDMLPDLAKRDKITIRRAFIAKCVMLSHYLLTGEKLEGKAAQMAHFHKLVAEEQKVVRS